MTTSSVTKNTNLAYTTSQNDVNPVDLFTTLFIKALNQHKLVDQNHLENIKTSLTVLKNSELNSPQTQESKFK